MSSSKSQIDRLGERLKSGKLSEDDLRGLDNYRLSFGLAYESVVDTVRSSLGLTATGRPAKSTSAIKAKLSRQSIRLSQIHDIAGCRTLVADVVEQDRVLVALRNIFPAADVDDRRERSSHGYRAVHVIPNVNGKRIEIQVRSALQHLWAELSEKLSDQLGTEIKYGQGPAEALELLTGYSGIIASHEDNERQTSMWPQGDEQIEELRLRFTQVRSQIRSYLERAISEIERIKK